MTKAQRDEIKHNAGDDVKMANRYTDSSGCVRVSGAWFLQNSKL